MKQTIIVFAVAAALLAAAPVSAQGQRGRANATSSASSTPVGASFGTSSSAQFNALQNRVLNTSRVMAAAAERLERIASRIESRIAKFKERGVSTTNAEAALEEARTRLSEARNGISALFAVDISTGTLQENLARLRSVVNGSNGSKTKLKEAHQALVRAIVALRGGSATSTRENIGN